MNTPGYGEQFIKQYVDAHHRQLRDQIERIAQLQIELCKNGFMTRGQLAQKLNKIGYNGLEIVEILENGGL
jgi:hypothetical protein